MLLIIMAIAFGVHYAMVPNTSGGASPVSIRENFVTNMGLFYMFMLGNGDDPFPDQSLTYWIV
jgi:hypothetical protein